MTTYLIDADIVASKQQQLQNKPLIGVMAYGLYMVI